MPYDPAKPASNSPLSSAEMRAQLSGLHDLIPQTATVDSVSTLPPGSPATASAGITGGVLHLSFEIPQGQPGEVTQAQLSNDLVNCQNAAVSTTLPLTSANSNAVDVLSVTSPDPVVQTVIDKVNELLLTLRR